MSSLLAPPPLSLRNAQRRVRLSAVALKRFGRIALTLAWPHRRPGSDIANIGLVTVTIISDRRIAGLHRRFCGIPGPTDVITFQHGEIFISAETARTNAHSFRTGTTEELRLYVLHGLLHLCGFDDATATDAREMQRWQLRLLREAAGRAGGQ